MEEVELLSLELLFDRHPDHHAHEVLRLALIDHRLRFLDAQPCILSSMQAAGPAFKPICFQLEDLGPRSLTRTRTGGAAWEEALELALEVALEKVLSETSRADS